MIVRRDKVHRHREEETDDSKTNHRLQALRGSRAFHVSKVDPHVWFSSSSSSSSSCSSSSLSSLFPSESCARFVLRVTIRLNYEERYIHSGFVSLVSPDVPDVGREAGTWPLAHLTLGQKKKEDEKKKRERERERERESALWRQTSLFFQAAAGLFGIKTKKKETYFIDKRVCVPSLATVSSRDETCLPRYTLLATQCLLLRQIKRR